MPQPVNNGFSERTEAFFSTAAGKWTGILLIAAAWIVPFVWYYSGWIWLRHDVGRELATLMVLRDGGKLYFDVMCWYGPTTYWTAAAFVRLIPFSLLESVHLFQLLLAAGMSALLFRLARHFSLGNTLAFALPLAYAALSSVNLDGTSFYLPYSLAATFSQGVFLVFALTVLRVFRNPDWINVVFCALAAGFLAASKQDYLPALGVTFLTVVALRFFRKEPVFSNAKDIALALVAAVVAVGISGMALRWSEEAFFGNWLFVDMMKAYYPNGSFYEFMRAWSPRMLGLFALAGTTVVLLARIPVEGKARFSVLLGAFSVGCLFPLMDLAKPVFYVGPLVYLLFRAVVAVRARTLPKPDEYLILAGVLLLLHSRQGTMNELVQAGNMLFWGKSLMEFSNVETAVFRRTMLFPAFIAGFVLVRFLSLPDRLNQGTELGEVSGENGTLKVSSVYAPAIREAIPEIQKRKENGVGFGQEAGWLAVLSGVPSSTRDYLWWGYNEKRVTHDLEMRPPGAIVLVYSDGRNNLNLFSRPDLLKAFIASNYSFSGHFSGGDMTIEIWDRTAR